MTAHCDGASKGSRTNVIVYIRHKIYNHHLLSKKSPCKPNLSYFFSNAVSIVYISRFVAFIYSIPHLSVCPILLLLDGLQKHFINTLPMRSFACHVASRRIHSQAIRLSCAYDWIWKHTIVFLSFIISEKKWAISLPLDVLSICCNCAECTCMDIFL